MATLVLIIGKSGSGKSASLRNFQPDEVDVINVEAKPLPFRSKIQTIDTDSYREISKTIKDSKKKVIVVDDASYLITNSFMRGHASQGGGNAMFSFYNQLADDFWKLVTWLRSLDKEKILSEANKNDSSIIFANPNAPTGISLTRAEVAEMIKTAPKDRIFVVDEAYCDFGGESCIPLLKDFDNLVIVRTFSKSLSFAGMRLGYVVSSPDLIKSIFTVKNSFNHFPLDFITQTAGAASADNAWYYAENARKIAAERDSFTDFLRQRGWFVIDSKTNFVFTKKDGLSGDAIYQSVKKAGILIRHFSTPGIEDFVRISIGTKEQMDMLKKVMEEL